MQGYPSLPLPLSLASQSPPPTTTSAAHVHHCATSMIVIAAPLLHPPLTQLQVPQLPMDDSNAVSVVSGSSSSEPPHSALLAPDLPLTSSCCLDFATVACSASTFAPRPCTHRGPHCMPPIHRYPTPTMSASLLGRTTLHPCPASLVFPPYPPDIDQRVPQPRQPTALWYALSSLNQARPNTGLHGAPAPAGMFSFHILPAPAWQLSWCTPHQATTAMGPTPVLCPRSHLLQ